MTQIPARITDWFSAKGWSIHPHQQDMFDRAQEPATLLIAPTGGGKTMAGFLPSLAELAEGAHSGLHTIYVSPLKALAADIKRNLRTPVDEIGLPIRIEDRTGDTSATQKKRQRADPPQILLTTPGKPRAADVLRRRPAHVCRVAAGDRGRNPRAGRKQSAAIS